MNKAKLLALTIASLVILNGCQTTESKTDMAPAAKADTMKVAAVAKVAATQAGAEEAIAAAEKARKKAASVKGEWRDTGKIIKKAKAALKKGQVEKAIELANQAEHQGHAGYEQAQSQKELRVPTYLQYN